MRRSLRWILVAWLVTVAVAACSSSTSSKPPAASPTPSPTSAAAAGAAAEQAIAANWAAFFDPKTPTAKRVTLLEDGQTFAPVLKAQEGSALASHASATVSKVSVTKPASQAAVQYSILISGQPALTNQSGTAVYQDGTWKVGASSFCGLLTLENGGSTASLPAACKAPA